MTDKRSHDIEIVLGSERFKFSTEAELRIDRDDLDTALAHQASMFAFFAVLHTRAVGERRQLEAELEELEYRLTLDKPAQLEKKGAKTTVDAVKAAVRTDDGYLDAASQVRAALQNESLAAVFKDAFWQRKDTLVTLARNRIREEGSPSAVEVEVEKFKKSYFGKGQ